ncbi:hypothetical protein J6590_016783 [Homalodisca vitripennis]|nr:hypothetical protein J6590_016783 [Homalodisca vitripennis]
MRKSCQWPAFKGWPPDVPSLGGLSLLRSPTGSGLGYDVIRTPEGVASTPKCLFYVLKARMNMPGIVVVLLSITALFSSVASGGAFKTPFFLFRVP